MRALVTGGAGFIGSHLTDRLLSDGWEVVVVDDLSGGCARPVPRPGLVFHEQRVEAYAGHSRLDTIFHLASPVGPVGVLRKPHGIVPAIVEGASDMAALATVNRCPLVFIGTSESYGPQEGAIPDDAPCVVAPEPSARAAYAIGKRAAETMLQLWPGLDLRIVRPFNVAGPGQRSRGGFVLPRWIEQASAGEPLTLYAPGTQERSFTHVADFIDGLMLVFERGEPDRPYNLGNPANRTTLADLAEQLRGRWHDRYGVRPDIVRVDPRDLHGPTFREAPDKFAAPGRAMGLGWRPWRTNLDIIRDAIGAVVAVAA